MYVLLLLKEDAGMIFIFKMLDVNNLLFFMSKIIWPIDKLSYVPALFFVLAILRDFFFVSNSIVIKDASKRLASA